MVRPYRHRTTAIASDPDAVDERSPLRAAMHAVWQRAGHASRVPGRSLLGAARRIDRVQARLVLFDTGEEIFLIFAGRGERQ